MLSRVRWGADSQESSQNHSGIARQSRPGPARATRCSRTLRVTSLRTQGTRAQMGRRTQLVMNRRRISANWTG